MSKRPVVTIKVFFVLWQSFWWIFDSDNGQRNLWWNRTLSYFSSNFDGYQPIRILFWNDEMMFTKQKHMVIKRQERENQLPENAMLLQVVLPQIWLPEVWYPVSIGGLTFSRSILNVVLSILKIISELVWVFSVQFFKKCIVCASLFPSRQPRSSCHPSSTVPKSPKDCNAH